MLVRADLFAELGGFDPATFPGAEDLDLCWRARIAGARVMVAPDARVRHRGADKVHDASDAISPAVVQRSRLRAMLKSASGWSLAYLLPIALLLAVVIKTYAIQAFFIPSGSMENTLEINDRVLVNKLVYDVRGIHRGDPLPLPSFHEG